MLLTSLKGELTEIFFILTVFFLLVLTSSTDCGALVVPTTTFPKSAPKVSVAPLILAWLLLLRNCSEPSSPCASADRANALITNSSAKVRAASDRVNDLTRMVTILLRLVLLFGLFC